MDKLKHLDYDVKIQALGSLFRVTGGSCWSMNIAFWPKQKKSSLRISNAPIIARQRTLNSTKEYGTAGREKIFTITDTHHWLIKKVTGCPALKSYKREDTYQNCFVFTLADGMTIYLPQFELARALFFHDGYLSRTSLEQGILSSEFDVRVDKTTEHAEINVMPSAGYSIEHFSNPGCRRVLSWILIDEDARQSYESIGKYQMLRGNDKNGYRFWDFSFEPPSLPNANFNVRGFIDYETNSMFVYEIISIRNIKSTVPLNVDIYHPKFKDTAQGQGEGSGNAGEGQEPKDENEVDDEETPSLEGHRTILQTETTALEFDKASKTNCIAKKKAPSNCGKLDEDESEPESTPNDVSTNQPDLTGNIPGADWDSLDDQTDDTHLYENKFTCFSKMLELLVNEHGCVIKSKQLRKLPKVGRSKSHILKTDGNPRCLAVVKLVVDGTTFYVLEVDTSDASTKLSTKILKQKSPSSFENDIEKLEKMLLKGSLGWPTKYLDELCGKGNHYGVPHPNSVHDGTLDPKSIEGWAGRFYNRILTV